MAELIPTWAEVNTWAFLGLASLALILLVLIFGRKEDDVVTWVRDWEEYE